MALVDSLKKGCPFGFVFGSLVDISVALGVLYITTVLLLLLFMMVYVLSRICLGEDVHIGNLTGDQCR